MLIKDGRAIETFHDVDTVIFDKTGTLTQGHLSVADIHLCAAYSPDDILRFAAAAEQKQSHPLAEAIVHEARLHQIAPPSILDSSYQAGYGVTVRTQEGQIHVGSSRYMAFEGIAMPPDMQELITHHAYTASFVAVAIDRKIAGVLELRATLRPEARQIIASLHQRGIEVWLVSGDHEEPTHQLAQDLHIRHALSAALPADKARLIARLRQQGRCVCMVGDGINDALALKQANVGISLRGASTLAADTAQIVLLDRAITPLLPLFDLTHGLQNNMERNVMISIVPGIFTIGGAYISNFGLLPVYLLFYSGFATGITNAMLPRILNKSDSDTPPQRI